MSDGQRRERLGLRLVEAALSTDAGSANRIFAADVAESVFDDSGTWSYYADSGAAIVATSVGSRIAANVVGYKKPDNAAANVIAGLSIAATFTPQTITAAGYVMGAMNTSGFAPCAGRIYGLVVTNYMQTEDQRQALARYLASKSGITL